MKLSLESGGFSVSVQTVTTERHSQLSEATEGQVRHIMDGVAKLLALVEREMGPVIPKG